LDQEICRYELIIENYIFKIKKYNFLNYIIQYVIYSGGVQQHLVFYLMIFFIYYNFSNIHSNKHKKKEENHLEERSYIRFCEFGEAKYPVFLVQGGNVVQGK